MTKRIPFLVALFPAFCFGADPTLVPEAEALRPTSKSPVIVPTDDKVKAARLREAVAAYDAVPAKEVTAHPSAADFPGAVSADAPRVTRKFTFAWNLPRWQSTGLYAAPGDKVLVSLAPADAARGVRVIIGCHTDDLGEHGKWPRFPKISRQFELTGPVTTVANAFGGMIYVSVPRDAKLAGHHLETYGGYGWLDEAADKVAGDFKIEIEGAVEAPLYRLGLTTDAEWERQKKSTAPWGELACGRIVITAPAADIAKVEHPAALLEFWTRVVDAEANLAGWPGQPRPPERVVLDREIGAGFMHSGYPIMAHVGSARSALSLTYLTTEGSWGLFHELGHNHEGQAYTFGGDFVEVDVNLFSMYVMETVVGVKRTNHPDLKDIDRLIRDRLESPPKVTPWTNLAIFIKTIDAFGWDPLRSTLRSYAVPGGTDGIKTREQKIDQWVLRYSKATGRNLADFYAAFDLKCSDTVRTQLADVKPWMPEKFPR